MKITISKNSKLPEILVFGLAFITRFFRLSTPNTYIFDEVYHAFTAEQMFKGNPAAWEWWNASPKGFAYEWTHPPVAKEFMVLAIAIFGDGSFAWRFFSALFGFGVIILIYLITKKLFKNRTIALLASLFATLDGLLLVMSRIGMNDMYSLFFALLAFLLFLNKKFMLMGLSLGVSLASKWTGLFAIEILGAVWVGSTVLAFRNNEIKKKELIKRVIHTPIYFLLLPLLVYLLSYAPFFAGHHSPPGSNMNTFQTFVELQQQMYWYHTGLKATHPYQSVPYQWVLDLRPVWIYVDYKTNSIANIYTLANPFLMWFGIIGIAFSFFEFIKKKTFSLAFILFSYFAFFVPWIFSPRIMFHYHYLPSIPFLCISLAYCVDRVLKTKNGLFISCIIIAPIFFAFFYFFPLWTAIHVPTAFYNSYFWIPSWK